MSLILRIGVLPMWLRATSVILAGILLSVWITGEATRALDERYLLGEMRSGVQRSTGLLAGLLSESVVTGDAGTADAMIKQYVSTWPQVTYVHVMEANGMLFTEWQQRPIKFGDGILKFEEPIRFGAQTFGTLSLYVDLNQPLQSIHEHVLTAQRREALTLLGLVMLIIAAVVYAAMLPFRELGERAAELLAQHGALKAAESDDDLARLNAALELLRKLLDKAS
ncbi:MAG: hypothetical protein HYR49_01455 [Gammaproteobacteria bacterium]|nr:hypothetical protein [Gammaproteobacteria bacterium]